MKHCLFYGKIVISATIIIYLLRIIPLSEIAEAVASAQLPLLILGLLTGPFTLLLSAVNTKILFDAQGVRLSFMKILEINYSSEFYNFLVPGAIPGGIIRWHQFSKSSGKPAASFATILFIRLWDTTVLLAVGAALWRMDALASKNHAAGVWLFLSTLILLGMSIAIFNTRTAAYMERILCRLTFIPSTVNGKIINVLHSLRAFDIVTWHITGSTVALTVLRNCTGITAYYLFTMSLGLNMSIISIGWVRSIIHAVLLLPITFSGVGIREGGMVLLLKEYNVLPAQAVALSFLVLVNTLGVRFIGLIVALAQVLRTSHDTESAWQSRLRDTGIRSICILGTRLSSDNIGDNAVFLGICDSFQKKPKVSFTVISSQPERVHRIYGVNSLSPRKDFLRIVAVLFKADALFITGGTPLYNDDVNMAYKAAIVWLMKMRKKPVVIHGISLREASSVLSRMLIRFIVKSADIAGGREAETVRAFREISAQKNMVRDFPDPAIEMQPIEPAAAAALLKTERVPTNGKKLVGICVRNLHAEASIQHKRYGRGFDAKARGRFYDVLAGTVEHLVTGKNAFVVFFPMDTDLSEDDRQGAREIMKRISSKRVLSNVISIESQYGPREMKGMLGLMYIVITVRFHPILLASSMSIPVIGIAYARKNADLMRDLGQSDFSMNLESTTTENLENVLQRVFDERETIAGVLRSRYDDIRREYRQRITEIEGLLNSYELRSL